MKLKFTCSKCQKTIYVEQKIYESTYKGKNLCLSCRAKEASDSDVNL